jgi:heat shock protein HtpX
MYNDIAANKRKTVVLIVIFTAVIIAVGWALGQQIDSASSGIIFAVMVATVMNLVGYYKGDAVALAASGAKQVERKDNPNLYNTVENLSIASGLPAPKVFIIDDPSPNAFATGRDPAHASIAVTSGLLQTMNKTELEGVLAHELAHIKNFDIRVMTIVVVLVGTVMLLSDILVRSMWFKDRRSNNDNGQAQLVLMLIGLVLAILSPILAELLKLAISRSREYLADASGALLTRYPEGLASALQKIADYDQPLKKANHATAHLFLANPFDPKVTKKFEQWFSTHPPIEERIARLRKMGR